MCSYVAQGRSYNILRIKSSYPNWFVRKLSLKWSRVSTLQKIIFKLFIFNTILPENDCLALENQPFIV